MVNSQTNCNAVLLYYLTLGKVQCKDLSFVTIDTTNNDNHTDNSTRSLE